MWIAQLEPPSSAVQGDQIYRTRQPCRAMADHAGVQVVSGCWLSSAMRTIAWRADVLVLAKTVDFDLLPLIEARRRAGRPTVFEINDDFTDLHAWNPVAPFYRSPENRALLSQLARLADGLQFSSDHLERRFGLLNSRRRVFPNQLATEPPPLAPRAGVVGRLLEIGFAGSLGHREDLRSILPVLSRVLARHEHARFSVMGPPSFEAMLRPLPRGRVRFVPGDSLERYLEFVAGLDVGLAPLLPTPFNDGRSDVKYLEYASRGTLAVCARRPPYAGTIQHGVDGLLFATPDALESQLDGLCRGEIDATSMIERAHRKVTRERLERDHAPARLSYYRSMGGARWSESGDDCDRAVRRAIAVHGEGSVVQNGEALHLALTAADGHLFNALQAAGDAERHLRAAEALEPDHALVALHRARSAGEGWQALFERAAALAPSACTPPLLRARRHGRLGETEDELAALQQTIERCPLVAPAWERLGQIAEGSGEHEAAGRFRRRALEVNPDYRPPALALARGLRARGRASEALALLEVRPPIGDADWAEDFERGLCELDLGRLDRALLALERAWAPRPERAAVGARLAKLKLELGDAAGARALLGQLRALAPAAARGSAPGPTP